MTSIFEGQPLKTKPFQTKTRVIWVPGIYIYISTMVSIIFLCSPLLAEMIQFDEQIFSIGSTTN